MLERLQQEMSRAPAALGGHLRSDATSPCWRRCLWCLAPPEQVLASHGQHNCHLTFSHYELAQHHRHGATGSLHSSW